MRIANVVGARPNFVKVAPLLLAMHKHRGIKPLLIHTGQHYSPEMSDAFFRELEIARPDFNLNVGAASPVSQTAEIMKRLEPLLIKCKPHCLVVVGDVTSTLSGALAAVKLQIPVAHVEAGLRSFDRSMPEEINRVATDAISDLLFVSEPSGVENLLREGQAPRRVFLVGNVMIDTLKRFLAAARRSTTLMDLGLSERAGAAPRIRYAVVTLHRPATVDNLRVLGKLWEALLDLSEQIRVIFPVHPRTRKRLRQGRFRTPPDRGSRGDHTGLKMIPPLSYLQFLHLQSEATLVATDSGGVQEETTALGVPCLTLRENTERPLTVTEGTNTVVGLDPDRFRQEAGRILAGKSKQGRIPQIWDGHSAGRVVEILYDCYGRHRFLGTKKSAEARTTRAPSVTIPRTPGRRGLKRVR
jgi:UDP-N-acetylglucosamine 2-epimerase (non-hydrolysing)